MDLHTDQFTLVHRPDTGIGLDSLSCPLFTHIYQETSCIYLTFDPKKNKKKIKRRLKLQRVPGLDTEASQVG